MTKTERSAPGALDGKIAAALDDGKTASGDDLQVLLGEVEAAIEEVDQIAKHERERSLDPTVSPNDANEAHSRAVVAELRRDRYKAALPRIEQRLREALQGEYAQRWDADYGAREREETLLAEEFREFYQAIQNKFPDLGRRIEACDRESNRVNAAAPEGEMRRLRGVEAVARDRAGFTLSDPSILQTVQLPDWKHAGTLVWPPPQPSIAALYAQSMVSHDDPRRYSGRWHEVLQEDNAKRAEIEAARAEEEQKRVAEQREAYYASLRR